jgi:histidyl-tRNA synthetase
MPPKFQPPKGMRDFPPEAASRLQKVLDTIRRVYELYGFVPLETPSLEGFDLLSAKGGLGEAVKDEIYYFKDKGDREVGLRFDMTMPLARYVLANPTMPKPFKRFAIGKVWRYDNPQAMRWREFWQADVDVIGTPTIFADAECVACAADALRALGFDDFVIRFNNRKMIEALLLKGGVPKEKINDAFRSIDKLDKIGSEGVEAELKQKGIKSEGILDLLKLKGRSDVILQRLETAKPDGLPETKQFLSLTSSLGLDKWLQLDLSLVRGLEYYTGLVFEISLGSKVSCGGGGRYDNLIGQLGGPATPATGISLGIDRILSVMEERKMAVVAAGSRVFVAAVGEELRPKAFEVARELRMLGIACEVDVAARPFSKQLEYANNRGYPFCVIIGPKEVASSTFKVKDMISGKESELSQEGFFSWAGKLV